MDISEIRERKRALEVEIAQKIREFQKETHTSVEAVSIDIVNDKFIDSIGICIETCEIDVKIDARI